MASPAHLAIDKDRLYFTGHYRNVDSAGDTFGVFIAAADTAGDVVWTKNIEYCSSQPGNGIHNKGIIVEDDIIYIFGYFYDTLRCDNVQLVSAGETDGFIITLDLSGNILWAKQYGGKRRDAVFDLTVHNQQVYMLASYTDSAYFSPQTLTDTGDANALVARLDTSGNLTWAKVFDTNLWKGRLRVTSSGDIIIGASFRDQLVADSFMLTSDGTDHIVPFLLHMDSTGYTTWVQVLDAYPVTTGDLLELDQSDSIYITTMYCWHGCTSYLRKYNYNSVEYSWQQYVMGMGDYNSDGFINDMLVAGNDIYTTGRRNDLYEYDNAADDTSYLMVQKYNIYGIEQWSNFSGTCNWTIESKGIVKGAHNDLYILGTFIDSVSLGSTTLLSPGAESIFIAKINDTTAYISGIPALEAQGGFSIYPNPSNGTFGIKGEANFEGTVELHIRNMQGQLVYSRNLTMGNERLSENIASTRLAPGTYIVEIGNKSKIMRQKLCIAY